MNQPTLEQKINICKKLLLEKHPDAPHSIIINLWDDGTDRVRCQYGDSSKLYIADFYNGELSYIEEPVLDGIGKQREDGVFFWVTTEEEMERYYSTNPTQIKTTPIPLHDFFSSTQQEVETEKEIPAALQEVREERVDSNDFKELLLIIFEMVNWINNGVSHGDFRFAAKRYQKRISEINVKYSMKPPTENQVHEVSEKEERVKAIILKMQDARDNFPAFGFESEFVRGFKKAFDMAIFIAEQLSTPQAASNEGRISIKEIPQVSALDGIINTALANATTDKDWIEGIQKVFWKTIGTLQEIANEGREENSSNNHPSKK